jgi:hypothetical protein
LLAFILTLAAILIVALFGGAVGTLMLRASLVRRLREHHSLIWSELGSPAPVGYDSGIVWKWVWARRYVKLNDPTTIRIAKTLRFVVLVFISSIAITFALMLVDQFLR